MVGPKVESINHVIICFEILGQFPQPHAEYSTDTVIYKGGPPNNGMRGPLPNVIFVIKLNLIS